MAAGRLVKIIRYARPASRSYPSRPIKRWWMESLEKTRYEHGEEEEEDEEDDEEEKEEEDTSKIFISYRILGNSH